MKNYDMLTIISSSQLQKCYPCRSSYCTTENLLGICNDNFHRYFHSCGYIHLHCVVYIHLRLRREYIIETVTNLRKWILNTKKETRRKRNKRKQAKQQQQQPQQKKYETPFYFFWCTMVMQQSVSVANVLVIL